MKEYSTTENNGLEMKLAKPFLNYNLIGAVSALFTFIDIMSVDRTKDELLMNDTSLTFVCLIAYFICVLILAVVFKFVGFLFDPHTLKIENGHIIIFTGLMQIRIRTNKIEVDNLGGQTKTMIERRYNAASPMVIGVTANGINKLLIADESEIEKLK